MNKKQDNLLLIGKCISNIVSPAHCNSKLTLLFIDGKIYFESLKRIHKRKLKNTTDCDDDFNDDNPEFLLDKEEITANKTTLGKTNYLG